MIPLLGQLQVKGFSLSRRIRKLAEPEGVWRTIRGRRVFIGKGESVAEALKKSLAGEKGKEKKEDWWREQPTTVRGHMDVYEDIVQTDSGSSGGLEGWHWREMRDHVKHIQPELLPAVRKRIVANIAMLSKRSRDDGAYVPSEIKRIKQIYGIQ